MSGRLALGAALLASLLLAAPAGAATTKGGSLTIPIAVTQQSPFAQPIAGVTFTSSPAGINSGAHQVLGPLALKRGGSYSAKTGRASVAAASNQKITVQATTTSQNTAASVTFHNINVEIGNKSVTVFGQVQSSTPAWAAPLGEFKLFTASKEKPRKSKRYKAIYSSDEVTVNSQLAGLIESTMIPEDVVQQVSTAKEFGSLSLKLK